MSSGTREPLLSSSPPSHSHAISIKNLHLGPSTCSAPFFSSLSPLPENSELPASPAPLPSSPYPSSPSLKSLLIFGPSPPPSSPCDDATAVLCPPPHALDDRPFLSASASASEPHSRSSSLHRSRTEPCMPALRNLSLPQHHAKPPRPGAAPGSPSVVRSAFVFLACYLFFGILVYSLAPDNFSTSSDSTHPVVDALYFCIVTMCTIGYGDITPATPLAKIFSILFVIIGFGFVDKIGRAHV